MQKYNNLKSKANEINVKTIQKSTCWMQKEHSLKYKIFCVKKKSDYKNKQILIKIKLICDLK